MKVSRNEMIRIRKNLLRQMDTFLRENVSEDVVIDVQLSCGLEDGWDDRVRKHRRAVSMLAENVVKSREFYKKGVDKQSTPWYNKYIR